MDKNIMTLLSKENTVDDRHLLNVLGLSEHDNLIVLCRDDTTFETEFVRVRPDILLWEQGTNHFMVIEYKSYPLYNNDISDYAYYQVVVQAIVIKAHLEKQLGKAVNVEPSLYYLNRKRIPLDYEQDEVELMTVTLEEMAASLPVAGSELAQAMAGSKVYISPQSALFRQDARLNGTRSHQQLLEPKKKT